MAIKINELPTTRKPLDAGLYWATITKTNTRVSSSKKENLNFQLKTAKGSYWDLISEAEDDTSQYKISRLLTATGITPELNKIPEVKKNGEVTFEQIAPLLVGKEVGVRVVHQDDRDGNPRANTSLRNHIYMTKEEYEAEVKANKEAATLI
jgi:hypothetical protein